MTESDASLGLPRHACSRHRHPDVLCPDDDEALVLTLLQTCESSDERALSILLDPDITVVVDGGGRVVAPTEPAHGAQEAARVLLDLFAAGLGVVATPQSVNGEAGLVFRTNHRVIGVLSLHARAGAILDIWIVLNPEKLQHWNAPGEESTLAVTNSAAPLSELMNRVLPNTPGQQEGRS